MLPQTYQRPRRATSPCPWRVKNPKSSTKIQGVSISRDRAKSSIRGLGSWLCFSAPLASAAASWRWALRDHTCFSPQHPSDPTCKALH